MNTPTLLLAASFSAYALAILAPVADHRLSGSGRSSFLLGGIGATLGALQAVLVLLGGAAPAGTLALPGTTSASPLLTLAFQEGPLSAFFLLVVSVSGAAVLLASVGYAERYVPEGRSRLAALCSLFLASMALVCLAGSVFLFLVAWEGMTLVSYLLVVHDHASAETRRAGYVYLVMSHVATGAVLVALLLLATNTGSAEWSGITAGSAALSPLVRNVVFVAALIGFGTKAGIVPLHVWLPEAHPAAPSNVSALMSGVMIKMGIFGLLLVVFELLGGGPPWWAYTILTVGALSALVGVLHAIAQHDLKRLLAYHSIENIGIILLGIGASLAFLDLGEPALAAVAMAAALLHTWNHALFKALLFLGAGAAVGEVGSRDLERMGGLIRRMPGVALGFLIGALAISALPPFNGFVSEWLLFQSFFGAFLTGSAGTEILFAALAAVLALTSGLAAYCFVKAFGIAFLARPRSAPAATARSAPTTLVAGMGVLASLCVVLGVVPIAALDLAHGPLLQLTGASLGSGVSLGLFSNLPSPSGASLSFAPGVVALLLAVGLLVAWAIWRFRAHPTRREAPTWDCGLDGTTSRMEYTASGYAQPVEHLFAGFYRPTETAVRQPPERPSWGDLTRLRSFVQQISDPIVDRFYTPLAHGTVALARQVSRLQSGRIHAYLAYLFVTLVALLLLLRLFGGLGA